MYETKCVPCSPTPDNFRNIAERNEKRLSDVRSRLGGVFSRLTGPQCESAACGTSCAESERGTWLSASLYGTGNTINEIEDMLTRIEEVL